MNHEPYFGGLCTGGNGGVECILGRGWPAAPEIGGTGGLCCGGRCFGGGCVACWSLLVRSSIRMSLRCKRCSSLLTFT